jgi:hypothetical protein
MWWNKLLQSSSTETNCTPSSSLTLNTFILMFVLNCAHTFDKVDFRGRISLRVKTMAAPRYWACFMPMPPFKLQVKVWPIRVIPYTVGSWLLFSILTFFTLFDLGSLFLVCLMNLHEEGRKLPTNGVQHGWLPVFDEIRDKRPGRGYEATSAREISWRMGKVNQGNSLNPFGQMV